METPISFAAPRASLPVASERPVCTFAAARKLGLSERTIRRRIQQGQLPAERINRRAWGILPCALASLRARRREP
jgi:hypothetical protein